VVNEALAEAEKALSTRDLSMVMDKWFLFG